MSEKKIILECDECPELFSCEHEMITEKEGIQLNVPHCDKCFFDDGKCKEEHGVMCPPCVVKFKRGEID